MGSGNDVRETAPPRQPVRSTDRRGGAQLWGERQFDDRENVAGGEDEVLLAVVLDLGAAVLR